MSESTDAERPLGKCLEDCGRDAVKEFRTFCEKCGRARESAAFTASPRLARPDYSTDRPVGRIVERKD